MSVPILIAAGFVIASFVSYGAAIPVESKSPF